MNFPKEQMWKWKEWDISWNKNYLGNENPSFSVLLIHGFGACKEHWRYNQPILSKKSRCYSIDLIGFGNSSQPNARLNNEYCDGESFCYSFDSWSNQIADFCKEIINQPVLLVGNSIGGVIALRTAQLINTQCTGLVLIDCAQRTMDDKRLKEQPKLMQFSRPLLKSLVRQRWLSTSLFRNASSKGVIKKVLQQAYPTGQNINEELLTLLQRPSQRLGASESFRGFINLFDDYLAPEILKDINIPVDLIWGENDPWEPLEEAKKWSDNFSCIRSLSIIPKAGHCPHDESPEEVNRLLLKIIDQVNI